MLGRAAFPLSALIGCAVLLALVLPLHAWHSEGHANLTRAAVAMLPEDVPAFFRSSVETPAHCAIDPDVFRDRLAPQLRAAEGPEHFLDLELLGDMKLPPSRLDYIKALIERDVGPGKVGFLPYAITEWTQRLTLAFAEHRKYPDNAHIQAKCLVYAGLLAHYAGDLANPLHCTIHFNGRVGEDGKSPGTGIHEKVDSLLEYRYFKLDALISDEAPVVLGDLLPAMMEEIRISNRQVDRVYELEAKLPADREARTLDPQVRELAHTCGRRGARLIADLYLTAWRKSADVKFPPWVDRNAWESDAHKQ